MRPTLRTRSSALAALFVSALGLTSTAHSQFQYPAGDIIVWGASGYGHVPRFGTVAAPTPLTYGPGTLAGAPELAYDIDQLTGDLIFTRSGAAAAGPIEIYRNVIGGPPATPTIAQQTLLGTLPGTTGFETVNVRSEPQGSFLVLVRDPRPGPTQNLSRIYRVGIGSSGMVSYLLSEVFPPFRPVDVTSDLQGNVHVAHASPGGTQATVATLVPTPPNGVSPYAYQQQSQRTLNGVDFNAIQMGNSAAGGGTPIAFAAGGRRIPGSGAPGNLYCGTAVAPQPVGSNLAVIVDLDNLANGNQLVVRAEPLLGGTQTVISEKGICGGVINNVLVSAVAAPQIIRARIADLTNTYGYSDYRPYNPIPANPGLFAMEPVLIAGPAGIPNGTTGNITMTGGPPNGSAIIRVGFSDAFDGGGNTLPMDLAPFGAPGSAFFCNASLTSTRALNAQGDGTYPATIPLNPALVGLTLYAQWETWSGPNPADYHTSNALQFVVQ